MFNCFTPRRVVVGVDVGTGSARAGVFDASYGARLATASAAIRTWTYGEGDFVEQSGDDIWRAVCLSVREAVSKAGCPAEAVVGVGFDATCSLVCLDSEQRPIGTDPTVPNDAERNIILWMDHRATEQADLINAKGWMLWPPIRFSYNTINYELTVPSPAPPSAEPCDYN